jgi:hypothetical protein
LVITQLLRLLWRWSVFISKKEIHKSEKATTQFKNHNLAYRGIDDRLRRVRFIDHVAYRIGRCTAINGVYDYVRLGLYSLHL